MPVPALRAILTVALLAADGGPLPSDPPAAPEAALIADGGLATPDPTAAPPVAILAEVVGLRNNNGQVGCALWNTEKGFPTDAPKALRYEFPKVEGRKAVCRFEGFPPGTYAIVVYHDENSNKRLDQGFMGIPTEGYGASNDARSFMAPPSFYKAKFEYSGQILKLRIHMSY